MSKQILVKIEDDLEKKLRHMQTDFKKEYGSNISFSDVLNEMLHNVFK